MALTSAAQMEAHAGEMRSVLPEQMLTEDGDVRLPFSKAGLKMAVLHSERFSRRNVQRHVDSGTVKVGVENNSRAHWWAVS